MKSEFRRKGHPVGKIIKDGLLDLSALLLNVNLCKLDPLKDLKFHLARTLISILFKSPGVYDFRLITLTMQMSSGKIRERSSTRSKLISQNFRNRNFPPVCA